MRPAGVRLYPKLACRLPGWLERNTECEKEDEVFLFASSGIHGNFGEKNNLPPPWQKQQLILLNRAGKRQTNNQHT